ncbi:unnamed protein product [Allacma fusca]|uniref:Uncharacterized protein n=1 Tax=Allacma fusca TaxID=39272 RepID=A0A8J2K5Q8_9HEXA|nr:unnamed protein product [Allacma fusca]
MYIPCMEAGTVCPNNTLEHDSDPLIDPPPPLVLPSSIRPFANLGCLFPAYLVIFCAFYLLSVTLLSQPGSWLKSFAILSVLTAHAVIFNLSPLKEAVDCSEEYSFPSHGDLIPESWYLGIFAGVVVLVLFSLNRRLLELPRFADNIIKIKTISSTYMAASGLSPLKQAKVTDETYKILLLYGYLFEQRGLVNVKGKGQLMTYYLVGRGPELTDEQVQKLLDEQAALEESQQNCQPLGSTLESH